MKKLLAIFFATAFLFACGKKQEGLTPEQETQLVDSIKQDFDAQKQDMQQKVDSLSTEVDSLLQGI